jgi:hypothetical protein
VDDTEVEPTEAVGIALEAAATYTVGFPPKAVTLPDMGV